MIRGGRVAIVALLLLAAQQSWPRAGAGPAADDPAPPPRLVDTGLYDEATASRVSDINRSFAPQYPLWSDGAVKRRWVRLPPGTRIEGTRNGWRFPVGTRFWKEFSFGGRRIETRFLWRATPESWVAATYVWNSDNSEAVLAPQDGVPNVFEIAPGRRHSIPSRGDCAACHGTTPAPLGFNALQLSTDRDAHAIHGEPLSAGMVTLRTMVEDGWLAQGDEDLVATPPRITATHPLTRAVLGYLSANCGTCHNRTKDITAQVPPLTYADVMTDGDAAARSLIRTPTRWQAPGRPDGHTLLIDPDAPDWSAMLLRMRSRRPSSQMPPLGTVLPDQEAIDVITRWIGEFGGPLRPR